MTENEISHNLIIFHIRLPSVYNSQAPYMPIKTFVSLFWKKHVIENIVFQSNK